MCGEAICGSAMCDCSCVIVIKPGDPRILAVRQEARDEFTRLLARGGLMVTEEAAARWWPGTHQTVQRSSRPPGPRPKIAKQASPKD